MTLLNTPLREPEKAWMNLDLQVSTPRCAFPKALEKLALRYRVEAAGIRRQPPASKRYIGNAPNCIGAARPPANKVAGPHKAPAHRGLMGQHPIPAPGRDGARVVNVDFASPSAFRRLLRQLRIYIRIIHRVDWFAMFIFARFEIVQKYAGRQRNTSSPSPHAAPEPSLLQTELPVQEIVRRISADGIADGLRLSEDSVAQVMSFAARAPCYGNAERHRQLNRGPCGCLIPADAVVGDYLDGIADCDVIRRLWRDPRMLAIAGLSLGTQRFL